MRALSYIILLAGLTGCPKNESTTTVDAASSAPAASVSQVTLAPLDTGSATATASTTAPVPTLGTPPAQTGIALKPPSLDGSFPIPTGSAKPTATATPAAQAQFKQCCAALHKQSQQQSPQAAQLAQAATMCDGLAAAMAGAPTMPQLDQVKTLLQGVPMPPVCQGL